MRALVPQWEGWSETLSPGCPPCPPQCPGWPEDSAGAGPTGRQGGGPSGPGCCPGLDPCSGVCPLAMALGRLCPDTSGMCREQGSGKMGPGDRGWGVEYRSHVSGLSLRPGTGPQPAEGPRGTQACVPECRVTLGVWLPPPQFLRSRAWQQGIKAEEPAAGLRLGLLAGGETEVGAAPRGLCSLPPAHSLRNRLNYSVSLPALPAINPGI